MYRGTYAETGFYDVPYNLDKMQEFDRLVRWISYIRSGKLLYI